MQRLDVIAPPALVCSSLAQEGEVRVLAPNQATPQARERTPLPITAQMMCEYATTQPPAYHTGHHAANSTGHNDNRAH